MTPNEREPSSPDPSPPNRHTSDHLANERTFLAWIRTSIAVIGLGFVVARFSVWLRELSSRFETAGMQVQHRGLSLPMGIGMMTAGGLLAVLAAIRYRRVHRAIDRNEPAASEHAVAIVTLLILAITASLVTYMLVTR